MSLVPAEKFSLTMFLRHPRADSILSDLSDMSSAEGATDCRLSGSKLHAMLGHMSTCRWASQMSLHKLMLCVSAASSATIQVCVWFADDSA